MIYVYIYTPNLLPGASVYLFWTAAKNISLEKVFEEKEMIDSYSLRERYD